MTHAQIAAAALVCSSVAAAALPGNRPGAGVVAVATMIAAVVVASRTTRLSAHGLICGALALALVSMAAVRAAGWVVGIDVMAAAFLASLAVSGGRSWREILRGLGAVWAGLVRGLSFVAGPIRNVAGSAVRERGSGLLRGLALGGALVVVFGALLASADRAFSQLAGRFLVPDFQPSLAAARLYLLVFVAALTGAYVVIGPRYATAGAGDGSDPFASPTRRTLGFWDWSIALGLLNTLFGAFVFVQMTVLFGGRHHVLETVGLGYAEYARQGFFQLVGVAALVMCVIAMTVHWARADTGRERMLLRLLLGLLCVLTLVILASALRRLTLYEDTYGFTRLRISVHAVILWLGILFGLVLVAGALWRADWLPRAFVYATAGCLLAFSLVNPEGIIARQNVERFERTGDVDVLYLRSLSADAVPALVRLPQDVRDCVFAAIGRHVADESWAAFNLSRRGAQRVLELTTQGSYASCAEDPYVPAGA